MRLSCRESEHAGRELRSCSGPHGLLGTVSKAGALAVNVLHEPEQRHQDRQCKSPGAMKMGNGAPGLGSGCP